MVCEFCGEEFDGKPVRQAGQVFCSIECADMAAEVGTDDEEYYEEDDLDLSPTDEEELY
ncbi:MAG: hypothetical protein AB1746_12165 [Candidatus Zixiibacteriota bacterium]